MKYPKKIKLTLKEKRAKRVRRKIFGTSERPRLSVNRSNKNIYVQLIDDIKGCTILGLSTLGADLKSQTIEGGKNEVSKALGKVVAEKAKEKGIKSIVFDRAGYLYHGRVKAVAEGAREGGLEF